jgi:uncharacterized protein YegL
MEAWAGWSKCSAQCGGGVQQRLREVKQAMKFNGKPCEPATETKSCNAQACEKDCVLGRWTKWSLCSKECDGGTKKRQKFVKEPAEGAGSCPDRWNKERLEYKKCAMHRCKVPVADMPLLCNRTLDVVFLLDGSGSMGKKGWKAEMKAAQYFVDAFTKSDKAMLSVILYSGPRTWSGVRKCVGKSAKKVKPEACGIKTVTHFTNDFKKVKQLLLGLELPKGSTLTSLALMTAKAELSLGRKSSGTPSVVVFTDGRPLSYRKTGIAASELRKQARLLWVPVAKNAPIKHIKKWATRRWQENVVPVPSFDALAKPDVITHIIANICPDEEPEMEMPPLN